ncbi:hypothetical protein GUJ93_ZPchr0005g15572 [Zizania palustris]|uniref:O-methyltransferase C-terminal domain-containing protein n=1 Tax=Zizania palustris TaxID=103762 RepID=A0A8J5W140_ZIZPA|nr:hypothetical protein GUJ93_ZPchr0005g15572 [Zizania palustris]
MCCLMCVLIVSGIFIVQHLSSSATSGKSSLADIVGGPSEVVLTILDFPEVKCRVLDLGHVIAKASIGTDVEYISGDMFDSVPLANVVLLKWMFHDWGDDGCVKILKNWPSDPKHKELHALYDLFIMLINGTDRDEQQWKKVIFEVGFSDYKIMLVLGFRSIFEVYP